MDASRHYDRANQQLKRWLQTKEQTPQIKEQCATIATINNVYEDFYGINDYNATARFLIHDCGWNAKSTEVAGACFWFNVGIEVLDCALYRHPTRIHPEYWNFGLGKPDTTARKRPLLALLDKSLYQIVHDTSVCLYCSKIFTGLAQDRISDLRQHERAKHGRMPGYPTEKGAYGKSYWVHFILYTLAKTVNYYAAAALGRPTSAQGAGKLTEGVRVWEHLLRLCIWWNDSRSWTIQPFASLDIRDRNQDYDSDWRFVDLGYSGICSLFLLASLILTDYYPKKLKLGSSSSTLRCVC